MSALLNTTNEAEGLPRRRFTVAEIERMVAARIIAEDERFELIGGELVPMSSKGGFHEMLKTALTLHWARRLPDGLLFTTETTLPLSADTYLEPDFVFYPQDSGWNGLSPSTARLVVEIADTSLAYDLGRKVSLCARFGIAELWVLDAKALTARIHREPASGIYRTIRDLPRDARLVPAATPELGVTLGELSLH